MYYDEKVNEAAAYLKSKISVKPDIAVVLGSGLGKTAECVKNAQCIPYKDIPYWPISTVKGHDGMLIAGTMHGKNIVVMQGRVHYYEGYSMQEVTFPMRVLGVLGIKAVILTNASGAINLDITPGSIAAITDQINFTGTNPLIGPNNDEWGVRFPDMTHCYDEEFIRIIDSAAESRKIPVKHGVYVGLSGPSFETPAEIRMFRTLGADLAGMSTVAEAIVANHMAIRVLGLSCASNYAAGITGNRLTHQEVIEAMDKTSSQLAELIEAFVDAVSL